MMNCNKFLLQININKFGNIKYAAYINLLMQKKNTNQLQTTKRKFPNKSFVNSSMINNAKCLQQNNK